MVDFPHDSKVNDRKNKCFLVQFMDRTREELCQYLCIFLLKVVEFKILIIIII